MWSPAVLGSHESCAAGLPLQTSDLYAPIQPTAFISAHMAQAPYAEPPEPSLAAQIPALSSEADYARPLCRATLLRGDKKIRDRQSWATTLRPC